MKASRHFQQTLYWLLILAFLITPQPANADSICPTAFSLDGVRINLCAPFLSDPQLSIPDQGNSIQIATMVDRNDPDKEFSVSALPFGVTDGSEAISPVDPSAEPDRTRDQLRTLREAQGGQPEPGPTATLFGQIVDGITSKVSLPGVSSARPALLTEWVFTAGNRLWIVRAVKWLKINSNGKMITSQPPKADGVVMQSPDPDAPSSSMAAQSRYPDDSLPITITASNDLPLPAWWNGPCDTFNYHNQTGAYYAYPLGTSYRGMEACGPGSVLDKAPDVLVYFFPGAWGSLEWECVELSMRFMYLAYGINPYRANGNQVVGNYSGTFFDKVVNGTQGIVPVPGDVLSYCSYCFVGHTSVVMASAINNFGNGTITVIEQNNTKKGQSTLPVTAWMVAGNAGPVIGWLHPHGTPQTPQAYMIYVPWLSAP